MLDILYFYISMYIFLSFFLNIDLWKTCKIALAKCFSHVKKKIMLCYVMLGQLDDAKRRKKRGWPNSLLKSLIKNELKLGTFTDKKLVLMKATVLIICTK